MRSYEGSRERTPIGEARPRLGSQQQGGPDLDGVGPGGAHLRGPLRGGDAARGDDRHVRVRPDDGDEVEQVGARGLLDRVEGAAVASAVGTLETEAVDSGAERGGCLVDVGDRGHGLDAGAAQLTQDGTDSEART